MCQENIATTLSTYSNSAILLDVRRRGEVIELDIREWLAEVLKALLVKLAADGIEAAMRKASKPERSAKHLRG